MRNGANQLGAIRFGIAEDQPLRDEALALAVVDARRKAEIMAGAAGVTLGPVLSMSSGGGVAPAPQPVMRAMAMEAAAVPVAEGELAISASVQMVFGME